MAERVTEWEQLEGGYDADLVRVVEQFRREIDALKRLQQAAPTPVEDEVTEAMLDAGASAYVRAMSGDSKCNHARLAAAYRAMHAARVPAPTPVPDGNKGGMAMPHSCAQCVYYSERTPSCGAYCRNFDSDTNALDICSHWKALPTPTPLHPDGLDAQIEQHERGLAEQREWLKAADAPTPEPSAEPSEELRLLRELENALVLWASPEEWARAATRKADVRLDYSTVYTIARLLAALDAAEGEGR